MELQINKISGGLVAFNIDFEDVVRQNNLLDFEMVMSLESGDVVKHAVPERKTVRILLAGGQGHFEAYLKRHYPYSLKELLKNLLRLSLPKTAFDEFRNIADFQRAGILTMAPVAAGIKRCGLLRTKSFLVSKEIGQCRRLDHLFLKHPTIPIKEKQEVIKKVALIVKHMHACGFNHKDLYLCHILLDSYGNIFLVDLHRVDKRGKVPERWKVKDIAALNYSAIEISASRTDRMRFLKTYLGFDRISEPQKSFALKIMKKTEKMIKHNRHKIRSFPEN